MNKYTLTILDIRAIQQYIFGSNDLKQIVGASGLVEAATHEWFFKKLIDLGDTNVDANGQFNGREINTNTTLISEVIYAGGGNVIVLFRGNSQDYAYQFTLNYTRKILRDASGLNLFITHMEFDWDGDILPQKVHQCFERINRKKQDHRFSTPVLGLGVTADCQYTGLPATFQVTNKYGNTLRISSDIKAKMDFHSSAENRLFSTINPPEDVRFIKDFNEFGTRGESSYIAVIHTDGNGMGQRIKNITRKFTSPAQNREYINDIRAFSQSIARATTQSLEYVVQLLRDNCKTNDEENQWEIGSIIKVSRRDGKLYLPFRPIIYGGDDSTFVCDGRLGLILTKIYLKELTSKSLALSDGLPLSIRAGIVIVKNHHPFARAVKMAEDLARSAKDYILEYQNKVFKEDSGSKFERISAIDWHFATGGPIEDIDSIRKREYTIQGDRYLCMRPVRLDPSTDGDLRTWDAFEGCIHAFQGNCWARRRNKLIGLMEVLRAGPEAVKQYCQVYQLPPLPDIRGDIKGEATVSGWVNKLCTCFDAIEALDFFIPLDENVGKRSNK